MIPNEHPGQNRTRCVEFTRLLGDGHIAQFYDRYKSIERIFYLIRGTNALVYPSGSVMFACGTYQGKEACESRWDHDIVGWRNNCKGGTNKELAWDQLLTDVQNPVKTKVIEKCCHNKTTAKHVSKLFIASAVHDVNFHHLIADSLARLTRYLPFLRRNPDVMIHIRQWELYYRTHVTYNMKQTEIDTAIKSRNNFFEILGNIQ